MKIEISTDNHIDGGQRLTQMAQEIVDERLDRYSDRLTRVEIHLSDENSSSKGGENDKRCLMEARPAGMQPIAVSDQGTSVEEALIGAADKMAKTLSRTFERQSETKGRTSFGGDQTI